MVSKNIEQSKSVLEKRENLKDFQEHRNYLIKVQDQLLKLEWDRDWNKFEHRLFQNLDNEEAKQRRKIEK